MDQPYFHTRSSLAHFVSILILFATAGLFFKFIGPIPLRINQITTQKSATFDAVGEGTATVAPDQAEIALGVTTTKTNVAAAKAETNQVINAVTKALKDSGVGEKQITTQNYSVSPNYDYQEGRNRITGYTVSATLRVKFTDFDKLNQAIDAAASLGANQIGNVSFTLSDEARAKAENEARSEAVKVAKAKAQSLAQAADIRLGKIINVQENISPQPGPLYRTMEAKVANAPDSTPTQIEPGTTEVKLSVTLSYETL